MSDKQRLDRFINRLAHKIARRYPNGCADADDYKQVGYLKLLEINRNRPENHNFIAYAIIAIGRAMRDAAVDAMYSVSAPRSAKKILNHITQLSDNGMTDVEICEKLKISCKTINYLRSLTNTQDIVDDDHIGNALPFSVIEDILSSSVITEDDKTIILSYLNNQRNRIGKNRKARWRRYKLLRPRLIRSGYGI